MNAVYVFGAGASLHAKYPLASKMGGELLTFMQKSGNDDFRVSAEQLIEMFGETPNIEDLVSDIEIMMDDLKVRKTHDEMFMWVKLTTGLGNLSRALREWFRTIHNGQANYYAEFSQKIVDSGDTVITFNYDDSLDRELRRSGKWELSTGYGFPFGKEQHASPVSLLKLHGSCNWLASLGGGITEGFTFIGYDGFMGGRPVIHTVDAEYLGYENFKGNVYPGGGTTLCMILPGRSKQFYFDTSGGIEFEEFWDHLWNQGRRALKTAQKVVICGYSMPQADERARDLLLKNTSKNASITIVSGGDSERIADDFRRAGFTNVELIGRGYFEDWLGQQ